MPALALTFVGFQLLQVRPLRTLSARNLRPSRRAAGLWHSVLYDWSVGRKLSEGSSYLVDPASSHMLVSKIKPCMSKYKLSKSETANGSLNQLWFLRSYNPTWITVVILELIHDNRSDLRGRTQLLVQNRSGASLYL